MGDTNRGIYHKFNITRTDRSSASGGKHENCRYFVLDLNHDPHAPAALLAYAESCKDTHPVLSADLRKESMTDKLTPSETLYGFCGWLTSRKEEVTLSTHHECGPVVDLIGQFCRANNLSDPREGWENNLIHPSGECSGPAL